ncbi:hypothetical protein [Leclercia sp. UBA1284]|uniref:hypothetical protein n=1 Tax=Leclercia sp. UBA1284 TaxID=1946737 RepID=UPI0025809A10|nr:hypothetical protein [Leclercia sp. UBA1284]
MKITQPKSKAKASLCLIITRQYDHRLTESWYGAGRPLAENREYCRLLNICSEADLQRIMMAGVPWLSLCVQQVDIGEAGISLMPKGISLTCALFIEAVAGDREQQAIFRHHLFWYQD